MRLLVDTAKVQFQVTRPVAEKTDQNGRQKTDRKSKELLWTVQTMALDETGAEVLNVTLAGDNAPKANVGAPCTFDELEAIVWVNKDGKPQVAYRAKAIHSQNPAKTSA